MQLDEIISSRSKTRVDAKDEADDNPSGNKTTLDTTRNLKQVMQVKGNESIVDKIVRQEMNDGKTMLWVRW